MQPDRVRNPNYVAPCYLGLSDPKVLQNYILSLITKYNQTEVISSIYLHNLLKKKWKRTNGKSISKNLVT